MDDIGGKAKDALTKGWGFLKSRAKETMDVTKTQGQIRDLQKRHEDLIKDLGHRTFAMMQAGKLDAEQIKERCAEIALLELEIQQLQEEAGVMKDQLKSHFEGVLPKSKNPCTQCGAQLTMVDRTCPQCKAPVGPTD